MEKRAAETSVSPQTTSKPTRSSLLGTLIPDASGIGKARAATWLALFLVVGFGFTARARALLAGRSLWLDEVVLATSIRDRGFVALLTEPLAFGQSAPPGFLVATKFFAEIFGTGLVWMRVVPFVSGVGTVLLAALFALRAFRRPSAQIAFVALASFSPTLVFYSAEMKQYSTDAFAMMLALYLSTYAREELPSLRAAFLGFLAVISSLPGLFVFGALGLLLVSGRAPGPVGRRAVEQFRANWAVLTSWAAGAAIHLVYSLVAGSDRARMKSWWGELNGFAPERVSGLSDLSWYSERFVEVFWLALENTRMVGPGTRNLDPLVLFATLALLALAVSRPGPSALTRPLLGAVALLAWLLAEFELYPLSSRLAIYLIPLVLALVVLGYEAGRASNTIGTKILVSAALLLITTTQASTALRQFDEPYIGRDMHGALEVLRRDLGPSDLVVTNPAGLPIVEWHRAARGLDFPLLVIHPDRIAEEFDRFLETEELPSRVWVIASHRQNEAASIAAAFAERYRFSSEYNRDGTYIALSSALGPVELKPTGDRRLVEVVTEGAGQ